MFLNTSWGHGDTRTRSSIRLGEILTNRLVIHISRRRLPRAAQKVKFRHNIPSISLNYETPAGLSHILGYHSSLRQAHSFHRPRGIRLITATRLSASTAPELALDGRLPLHAGIPLPPPPSWRWRGGFRFLLAFRFHRPRAGAGWAASASCWHERANQASDSSLPISMVYIDGWRLIPLQRITKGRIGTNPCLCLL